MFTNGTWLRIACVFVTLPAAWLPCQQTTPAAPTPAVQASDGAPPIVRMDTVPPAGPRVPTTVLDSSTSHPAPVSAIDALNKPELATDADGNSVLARARESFVTPTLEGSQLTAKDPLFGGREEHDTFIRELWQVSWRPNDKIDLYIILPRNVKNPPVVLYLYSFPTDTDRFKDDRWCDRVTRSGAAAVGIVSALTGQRYAYRPFKDWFISELPESLATTAHDLQMVLNQLEQRQDLDMKRVGIFAQGSGGAIAILAAAADPRIQALDLLDPWGDWPDWFAKSDALPEAERSTYLQPDFQKKLEPLEPLHFLPQLNNRKLRIQFVDENRESRDAVTKLQAAAPKSAEIVHFLTGRELYEVNSEGRLFSWIATAIHATPVAQPQRTQAQDAQQPISQKTN